MWAESNGLAIDVNMHGSFRRAARRLCQDGIIMGWDVVLPTFLDEEGRGRGYRHVFCVSPITGGAEELSPEQMEGVELMAHLVGLS
jgi:hypothetical protein